MAGLVKINTDGSSVDHGWGSYGGLAWDDQGRWIEGFCDIIGYANSLTTELWGMREGLKLARDRNWQKVIIESDSEVAVDLVHPCDIENHPDKTLISDCRRLMVELDADVIHILREGNRCADMIETVFPCGF